MKKLICKYCGSKIKAHNCLCYKKGRKRTMFTCSNQKLCPHPTIVVNSDLSDDYNKVAKAYLLKIEKSDPYFNDEVFI